MSQPVLEDDWLTPQQLADWLKIPVRTVYDWRTRSAGPSGYRVGKHLRYRRQDVLTWLADAQAPRDGATRAARSDRTVAVVEEIPRLRAPRRRRV